MAYFQRSAHGSMQRYQPTQIPHREAYGSPGQSTKVISRLALEGHVETCLQALYIPHVHDDVVRVLKDVSPTDGELKRVRYVVLGGGGGGGGGGRGRDEGPERYILLPIDSPSASV